MTKRIALIIVGIVLLSSVFVWFAGTVTNTSSASLVPAPLDQQTGLTTAQTSFLQLCTGLTTIDTNDDVVAVTNCLGRLRGFVDGHALTVRLAAVDPQSRSGIELWCVDPSVSDKRLLDSTIEWTDKNQQRVRELVEQYPDPSLARTAVMIAALHGVFPCEK